MPDISHYNPIDENAILKEVWNTANIGAKTELDDYQIQSVNKLLSMSKLFGNLFLDDNINNFMILQKSRNRKSMGEFVEVVKKKFSDDGMGGGFFNKMMG